MADETAHLRTAARFVPAAAGDGRRAHDLASAGPARQGGRTGGAAHAESADENEHSAGQRDQRHQRSSADKRSSAAILQGERDP